MSGATSTAQAAQAAPAAASGRDASVPAAVLARCQSVAAAEGMALASAVGSRTVASRTQVG